MKRDTIIVGAGAAGLMCAIEAGKRRQSVTIIDHTNTIGKKIQISGGGHCNFTNINTNHEDYLSSNPHFCKSALARFTPYDFIGLLEKHNIRYYEKENGQLLCKGSAGEIVDILHRECLEVNVEILLNCRIREVAKNDAFRLSTDHGSMESKSLVIATGGLSYPSTGATDLGYSVARQFGLGVTQLKPGLVPLTFTQNFIKTFGDLSGISIDTEASCKDKHFRGNLLFTHKGLSGPAVLQISSYWNKGDTLNINLLPDIDAYGLLMSKKTSRIEMRNLLSKYLPKRFSQKWCEMYIPSKLLCQYTDKELGDIANQLHNWAIKPSGTEGYNKAEVTVGGIVTGELSSQTMESKKVSGLYFIGEVIDVTGQLGGYNLQWAWASGYIAGQYA